MKKENSPEGSKALLLSGIPGESFCADKEGSKERERDAKEEFIDSRRRWFWADGKRNRFGAGV